MQEWAARILQRTVLQKVMEDLDFQVRERSLPLPADGPKAHAAIYFFFRPRPQVILLISLPQLVNVNPTISSLPYFSAL
jgi:hypothetical protein